MNYADMKVFLPLILLLLVGCASQNDEVENLRKRVNNLEKRLNEKQTDVNKQCMIKTCHRVKGDQNELLYKSTYNSKEQEIETIRYKPDGSVEMILSFEYNEHGDEIKQTHDYINGGSIWTITRKYDQNKKLIEVYHQEGIKEPTLERSYKYNELGVRIEEIDSEGGRSKNIYDSQGNLIEEKYFNKDGLYSSSTLYTYDKDGNVIEDKFISRNSNWSSRTVYEYDENGREVHQRTYGSKETLKYEFVSTYEFMDCTK